MEKPKVLILYNKIFHYRVPIWNLLAEKCDLTISFSEGQLPEGMQRNFKTFYIPYKKFGPFVWHKANIRKIASHFDVVLAYGDIMWLKYMFLPWFSNIKVAYWTIGVTTSNGYDTKPQKDFLFRFFYKRAKALVFYSDNPIAKYVNHGFKRESLFVANNTVEVLETNFPVKNNYIVFIGTLHKRKGLNLLLDTYLTLKVKCNLPKLVIVGNGPEYESTSKWINDNNMNELIEMKGNIIDPEIKANILSHALACISPKQAGLSVLECMGYGVPFVTTKDAITGGEKFNIHNNVDGIVMDNEQQLKDVVLDIAQSPEKYIQMGKKAKEYYQVNRMPIQMAEGLWQAIQYLRK